MDIVKGDGGPPAVLPDVDAKLNLLIVSYHVTLSEPLLQLISFVILPMPEDSYR
jgi:hypothetical protein